MIVTCFVSGSDEVVIMFGSFAVAVKVSYSVTAVPSGKVALIVAVSPVDVGDKEVGIALASTINVCFAGSSTIETETEAPPKLPLLSVAVIQIFTLPEVAPAAGVTVTLPVEASPDAVIIFESLLNASNA